MPLWLNIDHRYFVFGAFGVTAGIAVYSTYKLRNERTRRQTDNVYESQKLLNEYLVFHYSSPSEILKYDFGPKDSLDFPKRCAELCLKHFKVNVSSSKLVNISYHYTLITQLNIIRIIDVLDFDT
jgi:hypothetical protein